ncbi:MAG: transglycosylase SLT domain-containing protein [Alphaproteobacteria bacterium]|nr:transglycosylase SLT domain-containing protein [Alphaproteobacteria bacterium]
MRILKMVLAAAGASAAVSGAALADTRVVALSDADVEAYQAAYSAAERGDWRSAQTALRQVDDDVLVASVAAERLSQRRSGAAYSEYLRWLASHRDHAQASAVYARATAVRPRRGARPPHPESAPGRAPPGATRAPAGDSSALRGEIDAVMAHLSAGRLEEARIAGEALLSTPRNGDAAWLLGLTAFRQRDYSAAIGWFDIAAGWPHHGPAARAAAHYWAARANLAAGNPARVRDHLEAAAQAPATFYGQLAEAQLGRDSALDFAPPDVSDATMRAFIERHDSARRAAALAQLGRLSEVEDELRWLHARLRPDEDRVYLALAQALMAPAAQLRAAEYGGPDLASGHCPVTSFTPDNGFQFDRALVYAIVRQESRFNPVAISRSNARGLMQLLPSTATDMDPSQPFRREPTRLHEPGLNMRLGQAYVGWLIEQFHQDGDLGKVFAAYNGGPGWLQRWMSATPEDGDPLMLLESLPRAESRDYAERVLSHMGLCRKRFSQPTPEIDDLASGRPARYQALDARRADR